MECNIKYVRKRSSNGCAKISVKLPTFDGKSIAQKMGQEYVQAKYVLTYLHAPSSQGAFFEPCFLHEPADTTSSISRSQLYLPKKYDSSHESERITNHVSVSVSGSMQLCRAIRWIAAELQ